MSDLQGDTLGAAGEAHANRPQVDVIVGPADAGDEAQAGRAREIAAFTQLPFAESDDASVELRVIVTADQVELRWTEPDLKKRQPVRPISVDLLKLDITSGHGRSKKTPIAKAAGVVKGEGMQQPSVIDATAGLGEDAWLLASLGCRVIAIERNPVMAVLLADGLSRAGKTFPQIASRIALFHGSSIDALDALAKGEMPDWRRLYPGDDVESPLAAELHNADVVYIDPMFPHGRGSALEARPMRLLRRLVGPDVDADSLFEPAMAVAGSRVVVKRPRHAHALAGQTADVTHGGKAVRFDVYLPAVR